MKIVRSHSTNLRRHYEPNSKRDRIYDIELPVDIWSSYFGELPYAGDILGEKSQPVGFINGRRR